jgi:DNA-binding MarR family transcriptional regulator
VDREAGMSDRTARSPARKTAAKRQKPSPSGSIVWHPRVSDYLTLRINIVGKLLDRHSSRMLTKRFQLTLAEWRVLSQLALGSVSTVRALAEGMVVDRAEVSRAAMSLIERGCVAKQENPRDRRSPLFACTEQGRALYRTIRPARRRFQAKLAAELTPRQLDGLRQALDRLTVLLQEDERFQ